MFAAVLLAFAPRMADVRIPEAAPLVVSEATRVAPGSYLRPPLGADGRGGVIVLDKAKKLTLDLTGVSLRGTPAGIDLDQNAGWGIVLRDCEDVTIRGGTIGGYKGCLVAERCKNLVLDGLSFDGWYGQRLLSTVAAEDAADWLYPHENDANEWILDHGAAISLTDCSKVTVAACRGRHGQNGILLTRTSSARVYDCDFSFLSGWGLALFRSSSNVVSRNRFDYCVRGYSHDVYWRGQDSAGILLFERCCDNLFAWNSATHGGDGVFLFAGNDTVAGRAFEKGEMDAGGSDRNIWYRNDFSCAVANAIEATFSKDNWAIENRLSGSHQHGVWGGYSSRMVVLGNEIEDTLGGAVSIEHGQECAIVGNTIRRNQIGVELWWDEDPELFNGPFGKHRDTSSRDHYVLGNEFEENRRDLVLTNTEHVFLSGSRWGKPAGPIEGEGIRLDLLIGQGGNRASATIHASSFADLHGDPPEWLERAVAWKCPEVPGTQQAIAAPEGRRGLDSIVMGEWGPWDYRSGDPRPAQRQPGGLLAGNEWDATWFSWKDGPDPREDLEAWRALGARPTARAKVGVWTDPWGGDAQVRKSVGNDRFGLVASARVALAEGGKHRLAVTSDDGVRVRVDGKIAFEDWTWHAPKRGEAELSLAQGEHGLEIEYFQIDGAVALSIELVRAP
ncbi:MAG: right-handed parallel beta-helix repeat-containing protein [Planctomycetota bacterium]